MDTNQTSEKRKLKKGLKIGCLSVRALFLVLVLVVVARLLIPASDVEVNDADLLYDPEPVPEEQNAFFYINSLVESFDSNNISLGVFELEDELSAEKAVAEVEALDVKQMAVLRAIYDVADYDYYQVPFDKDAPLYAREIAPILPIYSIGQSSLCYIEFLMREGRDDEALECLRTHMRFGQMLQDGAYNLVAGMIGGAVKSQALHMMKHNLSEGRFEFGQRQAIGEIVDICHNDDVWMQMFRGEYASVKESYDDIDMSECTGSASIFKGLPWSLAACPGMYNKSRSLHQFAEYCEELFNAIYDPSVDVPEVVVPGMTRMFFSGNLVGELLFYIGAPSFGAIVDHKWKQDAQADLVKLYVAVWEYYEKNKALPDNLTKLVPEYISELPHDPFGESDSYLYAPQSKMIFSAGKDDDERLSILLGFVD